jgi:hypothetical protein
MLSDNNNIGSKEKLDTLEVIVHSDQFRNCPRLSGFLSYVVKEEIAGRQARLKALSIAMEVYGRSVEFDPQSNALIRVEAGRLRKALEIFYAKHRVGVDLEITIPKGSYVPTYRRLNDRRSAERTSEEPEEHDGERTVTEFGEMPFAAVQWSTQRSGSRCRLGEMRLPPTFVVDVGGRSFARVSGEGLDTIPATHRARPVLTSLGAGPGSEAIGHIDGKRLKSLEEENAKLKRLLADAILDNSVLKDLLSKKW